MICWLVCRKELSYSGAEHFWRVAQVFIAIAGEVDVRVRIVEAFVLADYVNNVVIAQHLSQIGLLHWNVIVLLGFVDVLELFVKALHSFRNDTNNLESFFYG